MPFVGRGKDRDRMNLQSGEQRVRDFTSIKVMKEMPTEPPRCPCFFLEFYCGHLVASVVFRKCRQLGTEREETNGTL